MRAIVVTGMPLTTVTSWGARVVERWTVMPAWRSRRSPWDRDVDLRLVGAAESVERRGGPVRQGCAGAACENGANEETVAAEELARDEGVDGVVDAVEPTGFDAVANRGLRETEAPELIQR